MIHLGDTYYSGTRAEQEAFLHDPIKAVLGEAIPVYLVPGNHDYYGGGGEGFYHVLDEFGVQPASYFTLRGAGVQIVAVDTGLLNNQGALLLREDGGVRERDKSSQSSTRPSVDYSPTMMPFLPDDQIDWALHQIEVGRQAGLKTIFMSHHQVGRRSLKIPVWCFDPPPPPVLVLLARRERRRRQQRLWRGAGRRLDSPWTAAAHACSCVQARRSRSPTGSRARSTCTRRASTASAPRSSPEG